MIPDRATPVTAGRTGYGSVTVLDARASRIYVAGRHDTELIAQVCVSGGDLRSEDVVVEHLGGMRRACEYEYCASAPDWAGTLAGVLVDHLVAQSRRGRGSPMRCAGDQAVLTPSSSVPVCLSISGRS